MATPRYLSKSRFLAGLHCPRRLWLLAWRPELGAAPSGMDALAMEQGTRFGRLAHDLFPGATAIAVDPADLSRAEADTATVIAAGADIVLEGAFRHGACRMLADVLQRRPDGRWELMEVKAATRVKAEHIPDLGYQLHVLSRCGLDVASCSVLHADTGGRAPDLPSLFRREDVSVRVEQELPAVERAVEALLPLLQEGAECPPVQFGQACLRCRFRAHCWAGIERPTIYEIIDNRHLVALERRGVFYVDDIPADAPLPRRTRQAVERMQQRRVDIDHERIRQLLRDLRYPLYFLDFESIATATPLFDDSAPWQKYAFQYSLHVLDSGGELRHFEYLHAALADPGPALARSLLQHLGEEGSVVVYSRMMEQGVLQSLAARLPALAPRLRDIIARLWDLEPVFRHSYRHWSWGLRSGIKTVLPTLVPELSYRSLGIRDGGSASLAWLQLVESPDPAGQTVLANSLRRYCELDTLAMVRLVEVIQRL